MGGDAKRPARLRMKHDPIVHFYRIRRLKLLAVPTSRERRKLSPEGPGTRFGRGDAEITTPHVLVNEHCSNVKI